MIMKKMYFGMFFCFIIMNFVLYAEVNALFSNTHYNIGKKMITKMDKKLEEDEEKAFLSGMVYADIGRFKFDKEVKINSDSEEFVNILEKFAKNDNETWFVKGMKMHIIQDSHTDEIISNIFGKNEEGYIGYIKDCGILEKYFSNVDNSYLYNDHLDKFSLDQVKKGLNIDKMFNKFHVPAGNIDILCKSILNNYYDHLKKDELDSSYNDLIIKAYESLGLDLNNEDINQQEANIVGSCAIISHVSEVKTDLSEIIESEIERISDLCLEFI